MARSTYLEIINSVKVLLREDEAVSSTADEYTSLIAKFVTMAKEKVEAAWDWSFQKRTVVVSSSAQQFTVTDGSVSLTPRGKLVEVYNSTDENILALAPSVKITRLLIEDSTTNIPIYYTSDVILSSGVRQIGVWPTPNGSKTYYITIVQPQDTITDGTYLEVDDNAVIWFAYYLALKERGEDGGVGPTDAYQLFQDSLNRQISLDSGFLADEETTWEVK